jgi:hypothetical protein
VSVKYANGDSGSGHRSLLHDFVVWRDTLRSIQHLGAFRTVQHNLAAGETTPEPIKVAE